MGNPGNTSPYNRSVSDERCTHTTLGRVYDDAGTGEFLASEDEITGQEQGGGTVLVTPGCPCTKSGGMFCLCGVSQLGEYKAAEVNHVKFLVFDHFS